ncbi:MAG: RNA polymerase factor sigma-32 [Alphaproteobacteria bacterium]
MTSQAKSRAAWKQQLFRKAQQQPMLSAEEEHRLARESLRGDSAAAARLVTTHLRFVIRIARAYRNYGLPMADLVQEGTVGLIHAVRRFNPDQGNRFATYAMWWIRAAIQDHVVRSWSLVRIGTTSAQRNLFLHLRRRAGAIHHGEDGLSDPTAKRLSKRFGLPIGDVLMLARRAFSHDRSLNVPADDRGQRQWIEAVTDSRPNPEDHLLALSHQRFWRRLVARALRALPLRERIIIRRRYLSDGKATFDTLSHDLGLSKERVRQLEASALGKLALALRPARRLEDLTA